MEKEYKDYTKEELIELLEIKDKVIEAHSQSTTALAEKYRDERVSAEFYKSQIEDLVKSRDSMCNRLNIASTREREVMQSLTTVRLNYDTLQNQYYELETKLHRIENEPFIQKANKRDKLSNRILVWLKLKKQ